MANSKVYLAEQAFRSKQVSNFEELSIKIGSSLGKFFSYALCTNLNVSVPSDHQIEAGEIEIDPVRFSKAYAKETNGGVFVLRNEFKAPLEEMKKVAKGLLIESITKEETDSINDFLKLIGLFETGQLTVEALLEIFEIPASPVPFVVEK